MRAGAVRISEGRSWVGGLGQNQVEAKMRELQRVREERARVEAEIARLKGGRVAPPPSVSAPTAAMVSAGRDPNAPAAAPAMSIGAAPTNWGKIALVIGGTALVVFVAVKLAKKKG